MKPSPATWFAWAQLVRLPNVFTVIADILMGYLFVRPSLLPLSLFLMATAASISLYWAGMILNDVYDLQQDRQERPQRPLPSGRISVGAATAAGYGLLVSGIAFGLLAGTWSPKFDVLPAALAGGLAVSVVLYDRWLKKTPFGPLVMGSCRSLNILLAMACAGVAAVDIGPQGLDASQLVVAASLGVYIAGVTWFARSEAVESPRGLLIGGLLVIITGLSLLATFPQWGAFVQQRPLVLRPQWVWPVLVALLGFTIVRRCMVAIATRDPVIIQTAVKQCILSLIVLDAAVCLAVRSPVGWAVGIAALLIPALTLGRYFYST